VRGPLDVVVISDFGEPVLKTVHDPAGDVTTTTKYTGGTKTSSIS
jgi:hypothetical protein